MEGGEESEEGLIKNERDSERCKWTLLRRNEARKRWAEYFKELLNVQEDREADIVAVGGCSGASNGGRE